MKDYNLYSKMEFVKMLLNNTPIAYVILDREYRIHFINESFVKLRKLDPNNTIGNKCYNLSNAGVRCGNCAVAKAFITKENVLVKRKDILHDQTLRFIDDYAIPLQLNEKGEVEFILEIMIDRTTEMIKREQRNKDYDEILNILSNLLEAKDSYTAKHSDNVRRIALNLALACNLERDQLLDISIAASLHDIGKVKIPDSIINKQGKLTDEEFFMIKNHPVYSYEMLENLSSFNHIREIAKHHHERIDGFGYPDKLKDNDISIGSKIIAIADTYDAITTTRSYRKSLSHEYAIDEIKRVSGTQLDSSLVDIFVELDFTSFKNSIFEIPKKSKGNVVERVITQVSNTVTEDSTEMKNLSDLDLNNLLLKIFNATPCGYIILNKDFNLDYASDFVFKYFDIDDNDKLKDIIIHSTKDLIEETFTTKSITKATKEIINNSLHKIFDIFIVPLINHNNSVGSVIQVIIDRTDEIVLDRTRASDFNKIIHILDEIYDSKKEDTDHQNLSPQIIELQNRLKELIERI